MSRNPIARSLRSPHLKPRVKPGMVKAPPEPEEWSDEMASLANTWGPPETYPAIIQRHTGIVLYHFPDIPEAAGMIDEALFTIEFLSEQLDEVLRIRRLRKKLFPFASDMSTLEGEVVAVPVKGDALVRLEEEQDD